MSKQLAEALEAKKGDRSLRALARDLEVAVGTAEGWINGWRTPEITHIGRLADYLEVDACDILQWELDDVGNPDFVHSLSRAPLSGRTVDYRHLPTLRSLKPRSVVDDNRRSAA